MKWFRDLSLGIKINVLVVLEFVALLTLILVVASRASSTFLSQGGRERIIQETQIMEQRLIEMQQQLSIAADMLRNTPGLITAVAAHDQPTIRAVALAAIAALRVDDFDIFDTNGERLIDSEDTGSSDGTGENAIVAQTLLGVQLTTILTEARNGEPTLSIVVSRPLRDETGAMVGGFMLGRQIDADFLVDLNFRRDSIDLSLIVDGVARASTYPDTAAPPNFIFQPALFAEALAGTAVVNPTNIISAQDRAYSESYVPVQGLDDRAPAGVVAVHVDMGNILEYQRSTLTTSLASVVPLLLIIVVVVIFFVRHTLVYRLDGLRRMTARFAQGDYQQREVIGGRDEIGQLGATLNQMAGEIARREHELRVLNESLDKRVTERTAELKIARDEAIIAQNLALESSRIKSEFLATMSHELRTPLNAIIGFTGIMLMGMRGKIDDDARYLIDRIDSNSKRLLGLINDVLDLAKIEAGRMEVVSTPISPHLLARIWEGQMSVLATQNGLEFAVEIDPTLPNKLLGDEARLSQITTNLLSNAFKFTKQGKVSLALKRRDQTWQIEVTDTGIGIPPHALDYIFDEFRQVDGSHSRAFGGTGLGLAIVKKLVLTMNGTIHVRSALGEGSTFTVELPLKPVSEPQFTS